MRKTASQVIRSLEARVARLERQSAGNDEVTANLIAKAVTPAFEKSHGLASFETPQADTDDDTGIITVSQVMVFKLSEAQFLSGLPAGQRNIKLPRSGTFKKTLAKAIEEEAYEERITLNSRGQKSTRVVYRDLAKEYTFTGEVSYDGDDLVVEDVSYRRGNFAMTVLYKHYYKPAQARGEDMDSYMRDDYNY